MKIQPYQTCRTSEGWQPIKVPSQSREGDSHLVMVCPWGNPRENICDCPGYYYRFECRHQLEAMDLVCGWSELHRPQKFVQTEQQRTNRVCPRCGGPTDWRMEVIESDEDEEPARTDS